MKHSVFACCLTLMLLPVPPAIAADDADTRAIAEEEKDRLAREKRELAEREALLRRQLETRKKLAAEQQTHIEELRRQIRELKAAD